MKPKKSSEIFSAAALLFSIGSILLYGTLSEAKLYPFSIQFKVYTLLNLIVLAVLIAAVVYSILEANKKLRNSLFMVATLFILAFNSYISYQTIIAFVTPSEHEIASQERFARIKALKASEINTVSVFRYLKSHDFKTVPLETTSEGKIFIKNINDKEELTKFQNILNGCSFDEFPRFKPTDDSYYVVIHLRDNSELEFDISHLKDTEKTYIIFTYSSKPPSDNVHYGAAYTDNIHDLIESHK